MNNIDTLGDALPREMKRVREEIIPVYQTCGNSGQLAIALMNSDLSKAEIALASGDTVKMIEAYNALKEYKL